MLTHDYTLICEHARLEMGGKWTIIGLTHGIGTPQIPFPLPMLTFFQVLQADGAGHSKFNVKLSELTTGNMLAQAQGETHYQGAGPVYLPIALPNLQFRAFGVYTWALEIEGQDDPILTEFSVVHVPLRTRIPPMPPQQRRPN